MYVVQIRSIGYHSETRLDVRPALEHREREDVHLPVACVHLDGLPHRVLPHPPPHHVHCSQSSQHLAGLPSQGTPVQDRPTTRPPEVQLRRLVPDVPLQEEHGVLQRVDQQNQRGH